MHRDITVMSLLLHNSETHNTHNIHFPIIPVYTLHMYSTVLPSNDTTYTCASLFLHFKGPITHDILRYLSTPDPHVAVLM